MTQDRLARQVSRHLEGEAPSDRLSRLLDEVRVTYAAYEDRLALAHRSLDLSSEEMLRAGMETEKLNQSMSAVLDGLGHGLLQFGKDGICAPVFSKACVTLLEANPGGQHIGDVLRLDAAGKQDLQSLIDVVFDGSSTIFPFEDLMKHAPRGYAHPKGLAIALDYRPMYDYSGNLTSILMVVQDITREEAVREEIRQKEARIVRMLRIAKDKLAFVRYLRRMEALFLKEGKPGSAEDFGRDIHTLKGMSKFFHLDVIAKILHEIENVLQTGQVSVPEVIITCRETLSALFEEAKSYGREIWGGNFEIEEDVITIPVSYATEFGKELRSMGAQGISNRFFQKIVAQPVRDLLVPFETQLAYFAEMAGKKVSIAMPESGEVRVFAVVYKEVFESLVHVARNIVDHAAEPPEEREKAGKTPALNVNVGASYENEFRHKLLIRISDDGGGIRVERLRQKLVEAGIAPEAGDEAVMQHIFDANISTRDGVSEEAGRGIGMNAVKSAAEKLGGSVHVDSEAGRGTVLTIRLPVIWEPA